MLTSRAVKAFMEKVRNSPYRTKIRVCKWQDDPAIAHPDVHLGGELSIFYPDWAHELVVPNHCSKEELIKLVDEFITKEK